MLREVLLFLPVNTLTIPSTVVAFANMRCGFVGWNDSRGLGWRTGKKYGLRNDQNGEIAQETVHTVIIVDPDWLA
jgi:hypothetical protein